MEVRGQFKGMLRKKNDGEGAQIGRADPHVLFITHRDRNHAHIPVPMIISSRAAKIHVSSRMALNSCREADWHFQFSAITDGATENGYRR